MTKNVWVGVCFLSCARDISRLRILDSLCTSSHYLPLSSSLLLLQQPGGTISEISEED